MSLEQLGSIPENEGAGRPLVLILIEERLLSRLPGAVEGPSDLRPALDRFAEDLRRDGYRARLVSARVHAGVEHQDGRILLALRRFFQRIQRDAPPFAGAVLVGSFPEAFLVRSCNWRKRTKLTLNKGKAEEKTFAEPVPYLRTVPEPVARRAEVVLCDLDGNWEERYVCARERLPTVIGVFPDGIPPRGGICRDYERGMDDV